MHGRNRAQYKAKMRDPKVAAGLQHKAAQWYKLTSGLLEKMRVVRENPQEAAVPPLLTLTSNLLMVNPDPLYIWNHRRELLELQQEGVDFQQEWSLTQSCLERNPKAYGVWFHRKWCVLECCSRQQDDSLALLQRELQLTELFLGLDERNFHCWNYRRFVVGCMMDPNHPNEAIMNNDDLLLFGKQVAKEHTPCRAKFDLLRAEFDFTTTKIQQNFSNGSAFHYRSKLLPIMLQDGNDLLEQEMELVHNAIFTEPDDQTAWWYYSFLMETFPDRYDWSEQVELLQELVETENHKTKWGMLGLVQVLQILGRDTSEWLHKLALLDPDRKERYKCL